MVALRRCMPLLLRVRGFSGGPAAWGGGAVLGLVGRLDRTEPAPSGALAVRDAESLFLAGFVDVLGGGERSVGVG